MTQEEVTAQVQGIDELLDRERPPAWIAKEAGDTILGTLVRYEKGTTAYGEADILVIRTTEGERSLWLLGVALRNQVGKAKPQPGEVIGAKYLGKRTSAGGTEYADWKVVVDRPDAPPDFDSMAAETEP